MLSKPKYMLPGNLSQGAPILEPDENNKYNFSFTLDGDEEIKEFVLNIRNQSSIIAKQDYSFTISRKTDSGDDGEEKSAEAVIFQNYSYIKSYLEEKDDLITINIVLKLEETRIPIDLTNSQIALDSNEVANFILELSFEDSEFIAPLTITQNSQKLTKINGEKRIYILKGLKDIAKTFTATIECELKKENDKYYLYLLNPENPEIIFSNTFSWYEYNSFFLNFKTSSRSLMSGQMDTTTWKNDSFQEDYNEISGLKYTLSSSGGGIYYGFEEEAKKISEFSKPFYFYNYQQSRHQITKDALISIVEENKESEKDFSTLFSKSVNALRNSTKNKTIVPGIEELIFRINKASLPSTISCKLLLSQPKNVKVLSKKQVENSYPYDIQGKVQLFTCSFAKDEIDNVIQLNKEYSWDIEVFGEQSIITSNNVYFKRKEKEKYQIVKEEDLYGLIKENADEEKYFIHLEIIEYKYKILDASTNEIIYTSPLLFNKEVVFNHFPLSFSPINLIIIVEFTDNQMHTHQCSFYLESNKSKREDITFKYTSYLNQIEFLNLEEEKTYYLFRKSNNGLFFLTDTITSNNNVFIDNFNNQTNFIYYLVSDNEYAESLAYENINIDKWRLILTKEKKSDIIYSVDKVYDFYYNLISGSIGNNAETIVNTNFTNMPSVQKGFSNYWSGSLSALMGICDEQGEFAQTIEQEKALEQLILDQEHDKFLLDREGNIWQVEISAPLTIANQDGLVQIDKLIDLKTITINWVQVGSPTQIVFNFEE